MADNMEPLGETPARGNPLVNKRPPIWQELVIQLFFQPGKFFSDLSILLQTKYVVAVTWVFGISQAMDRIDRELLKADFNTDSGMAGLLATYLDTWAGYWGFVLVYGSIAALFLWWIGGWWYRKRLEWSGAEDPDHRLARVVYIYASFVLAAPYVITTLIQTSLYDNYIQAYNSEALWPVILIIFPFWSLVVSYTGIRTTFEVSKWKTMTWFVILPGLLYLVMFGAIIAAYLLILAE
jgi:hypothetical protein